LKGDRWSRGVEIDYPSEKAQIDHNFAGSGDDVPKSRRGGRSRDDWNPASVAKPDDFNELFF
jgi:hypothetical protein